LFLFIFVCGLSPEKWKVGQQAGTLRQRTRNTRCENGEKGHFGSFWVVLEHFGACNCGSGFPFQIIASLFLMPHGTELLRDFASVFSFKASQVPYCYKILRLFSVLMPPQYQIAVRCLRLFSVLMPHSTELLRVFASVFSPNASQYRIAARFCVCSQF
jgi:hypothetical protein